MKNLTPESVGIIIYYSLSFAPLSYEIGEGLGVR
jgi:hypothetical protein